MLLLRTAALRCRAPAAPRCPPAGCTASRTAASYVQGQSPEPRIREYFYYIDHQGQSAALQSERPLRGGLPLPVPVRQGEELPALRRPTGGLHPPAADPPGGAARHRGRRRAAVVLRRRGEAVRPVPPGGAVHAPGQREALPPRDGAGGRRPRQVGSGHRAQLVLRLRAGGRPIGTAHTLPLGRAEARSDQ
ncbi:UPF0598 protein C8orf82 homolog isoform X2 [Brachyistius frenatus]|uniref:UPF0598 protein C8orf82 homolog isoform X2 n=1 Tax=Brachyistius frenatus TaxID=100188 RepID=UPI0037E778EC